MRSEVNWYHYAGLRVASEIPLPEWMPFEQHSPGYENDVYISVREVSDSEAAPEGNEQATKTECRLVVPAVGWFDIGGGRHIVVHRKREVSPRLLRQWLLGSAWGALCYQRGLFLIHASAAMVGSQAVLFCAPAKGGKSTLAAWLNSRQHRLVSDDLCHVDFAAAGSPHVYPSVPRLKLWADAIEGLGPASQCVKQDPTRPDKFHVEEIAIVQKESAPIKAIYLLQWGELGLSLIAGTTAFRRFLSSATYRPRLLQSNEDSGLYYRQSVCLLQRVPVWELSRPKDAGMIPATLDLLAKHWAEDRTI